MESLGLHCLKSFDLSLTAAQCTARLKNIQNHFYTSFLSNPVLFLSFHSQILLNEKCFFLSWYFVQQTVPFYSPLNGEEMRADSSHTEISVIVWRRVTSAPQWQQLLINPTSHHPALPIGGFSPKLFPLHFSSVCLTLCGAGGGISRTAVSQPAAVLCA